MIPYSDLQLLEVSTRRFEHNLVSTRLKGPLYAASAVFERSVAAERWFVTAKIESSLPLRKNWGATLYAEGTSDVGALAQVYREKTTSRETTIEWHRSLSELSGPTLELNSENSKLQFALPTGGPGVEVPIVSAAELPFLIQDVWVPEGGPKSLFIIAGRKFYAATLVVQGRRKILGSIEQVKIESPRPDWWGLLAESLG